jgi:hypothetical protein
MALTDFSPESVEVPVGKTTVCVRGFTLEDLSLLLRLHLEDVSKIIQLIQLAKGVAAEGADESVMTEAIVRLIVDAPGVASNIIAIAADEDRSADLALRLPLAVQIRLLSEIGRMTFEDMGGPGNFLAVFRTTLAGLGIDLDGVGTPPETSSK